MRRMSGLFMPENRIFPQNRALPSGQGCDTLGGTNAVEGANWPESGGMEGTYAAYRMPSVLGRWF